MVTDSLEDLINATHYNDRITRNMVREVESIKRDMTAAKDEAKTSTKKLQDMESKKREFQKLYDETVVKVCSAEVVNNILQSKLNEKTSAFDELKILLSKAEENYKEKSTLYESLVVTYQDLESNALIFSSPDSPDIEALKNDVKCKDEAMKDLQIVLSEYKELVRNCPRTSTPSFTLTGKVRFPEQIPSITLPTTGPHQRLEAIVAWERELIVDLKKISATHALPFWKKQKKAAAQAHRNFVSMNDRGKTW